MASPAEIQAQLERGWSVFLDMKSKDIERAKDGCGCCGNSTTQCLFLINTGLQWRVDNGIYDDTTDKLFSDMMEIIGAGTPVYGPTVDAGPSQIIYQPDDDVTMNGTVMVGDNPISQTMWTQLSGPNQANIVDPTSLTITINGMVPGTYVFKLTAVDTIGKIGFDTTTVSLVAANVVAYYWNQPTNVIPSENDIKELPSVSFVSGGDIVVPFAYSEVPAYSFVAYVLAEPSKTTWSDTVEFWNNGVVGEPGGLFSSYVTVGSLRVTVTNYKTQFINPIKFQ